MTFVHFGNLFFAGIVAGMEIVIHYGLTAPAKLRTEQSQVQLRQATILRLRVLIPAILAPTALSGLAVVLMDGTAPGLWFRVGVWAAISAFAFFLTAIALQMSTS